MGLTQLASSNPCERCVKSLIVECIECDAGSNETLAEVMTGSLIRLGVHARS